MKTLNEISRRLEYLRGEIRKESISYDELCELHSLSKYISPSDIDLLQFAGIEEKIFS